MIKKFQSRYEKSKPFTIFLINNTKLSLIYNHIPVEPNIDLNKIKTMVMSYDVH